MERQDLERMSREQLIAQAERLGIPRPRVLTAPDLVDEIIGRTAKGDRERQKQRGWLGRARDLLSKVVEKGLHLPEAARALRQQEKAWPAPPPPLPTVTLAEIYAAQGHLERALAVLDEVLVREPDHREAKALRQRFTEQAHRSRARTGQVKERESETEAPPAADPPAQAAPVEEAAATEEAPAQAAPVEEASPPPAQAPAIEVHEPASELPVTLDAPRGLEPPPAVAAVLAGETPALPPPVEVEPAVAETAEAEPALAALEEPPLPQRYEVDEVVAIAVDPRTVYLYWEVRPTTLAHARAAHPDGTLAVRLASVTASWEGPVVDTRDVHVDALYGDRFIRDVQPGSNVRVSVGWKSEAGFEPLAVAAEVTAPRMVPVEAVSRDVARWEAEPVAPFTTRRAVAPGPAVAPEPAARPGVGWFAAPGAVAPVVVPRLRAGAAAQLSGHGVPVDTGVALWGDPSGAPSVVEAEREEVEAEAWFQAGGASELSRGGPARVRRGPVRILVPAVPVRFGGASELGPGA